MYHVLIGLIVAGILARIYRARAQNIRGAVITDEIDSRSHISTVSNPRLDLVNQSSQINEAKNLISQAYEKLKTSASSQNKPMTSSNLTPGVSDNGLAKLKEYIDAVVTKQNQLIANLNKTQPDTGMEKALMSMIQNQQSIASQMQAQMLSQLVKVGQNDNAMDSKMMASMNEMFKMLASSIGKSQQSGTPPQMGKPSQPPSPTLPNLKPDPMSNIGQGGNWQKDLMGSIQGLLKDPSQIGKIAEGLGKITGQLAKLPEMVYEGAKTGFQQAQTKPEGKSDSNMFRENPWTKELEIWNPATGKWEGAMKEVDKEGDISDLGAISMDVKPLFEQRDNPWTGEPEYKDPVTGEWKPMSMATGLSDDEWTQLMAELDAYFKTPDTVPEDAFDEITALNDEGYNNINGTIPLDEPVMDATLGTVEWWGGWTDPSTGEPYVWDDIMNEPESEMWIDPATGNPMEWEEMFWDESDIIDSYTDPATGVDSTWEEMFWDESDLGDYIDPATNESGSWEDMFWDESEYIAPVNYAEDSWDSLFWDESEYMSDTQTYSDTEWENMFWDESDYIYDNPTYSDTDWGNMFWDESEYFSDSYDTTDYDGWDEMFWDESDDMYSLASDYGDYSGYEDAYEGEYY